FKLEVEGALVEDIPTHRMDEMLTSDTVEAFTAVLSGCVQPKDATRVSKALRSSNIIAQSVSTQVRAILVLFSSKREPFAKRAGAKLLLCFSKDLSPTRADIYGALRNDTASSEAEKCREGVRLLVQDMNQRLNTYLPSTNLVVDMASITTAGS